MTKISIKDQFTYHPPRTEERKLKHEYINNASLNYAEELINIIGDTDQNQTIINLIQQVRMLCNQIVTYQDLEK
jgi:hypothetical protein